MRTLKARNGIFTCYANDLIARIIEEFGLFQGSEIAMLSSVLEEGDTVIDVGAHIGTFCIPLKKIVGLSGQVIAFEANPVTFSLLQKNINDNNVQIAAYNKGVSDQDGPLFLRGKFIEERCENDTVVPINSGKDHLVNAQETKDGDVSVDLLKLDALSLQKIDLIKIDVEGMESSVLRSAHNSIQRFRPIIYTEYMPSYIVRAGEDPSDLKHFCHTNRYHLFVNILASNMATDMFQLLRVPDPEYCSGQVDFLLIHRESKRYPIKYLNWYFYKPHVFLLNKFKNRLKRLLGHK